MMLESGDMVLISQRRLFEGDEDRYFIGRTIVCEGPLIKAEGYSFVRGLSSGHIIKKPEKRTKVLSLSSLGQIVYQLPNDIDLEFVDIIVQHSDVVLVAGPRQIMNLSEHTHCGHF